jgi:outer membrane lipoprotein-sorting protein
MIRLRVLAGAFTFLAIGVLCLRAQDTPDLKAVLKKTIEAHGGEKALSKFDAVHTKFKGTIELLGGKRDISGEVSRQKPDKVRNETKLNINDMNIDIVTVFDGKKLWVAAGGMTREIDDEKVLKSMREELQIEGAQSLGDLLKAPYELNALGEVKVKGKDAIGIRISKKGQKDFSLFIDKKTHFIVKTEVRAIDANSGEEYTKESYITAYQDKGGAKVAKHVEIHKDGELFLDLEITDTEARDKFADSVFAKP